MIGSFVIDVEAAADRYLVTCSGEFDLATADRFREAVEEVVKARPPRAHLDCSGVTFIDSTGIRALIHTATACRDADIDMTVTMSPEMRRLFDTVGVTELFSLVP